MWKRHPSPIRREASIDLADRSPGCNARVPSADGTDVIAPAGTPVGQARRHGGNQRVRWAVASSAAPCGGRHGVSTDLEPWLPSGASRGLLVAPAGYMGPQGVNPRNPSVLVFIRL